MTTLDDDLKELMKANIKRHLQSNNSGGILNNLHNASRQAFQNPSSSQNKVQEQQFVSFMTSAIMGSAFTNLTRPPLPNLRLTIPTISEQEFADEQSEISSLNQGSILSGSQKFSLASPSPHGSILGSPFGRESFRKSKRITPKHTTPKSKTADEIRLTTLRNYIAILNQYNTVPMDVSYEETIEEMLHKIVAELAGNFMSAC